MRIGEYVAVEFGAKGNAFFMFPWGDLPKRLRDCLNSHAAMDIAVDDIKEKMRASVYLHHRDGSQIGKWESRFNNEILPLLELNIVKSGPSKATSSYLKSCAKISQSQRSSQVLSDVNLSVSQNEIEAFAAKWEIPLEDNRTRGGALWLRTDKQTFALEKWGFKYKAGKGWWKE